MRICARSFTRSASGTAARRLAMPFSTDCSRRPWFPSPTGEDGVGASAQEVPEFVRERVVVKLQALEDGRRVKLADVIGTEDHHRKPLGQCAALVFEAEKGLDRLHHRQPRDRLAKEAERPGPLPRDIDE